MPLNLVFIRLLDSSNPYSLRSQLDDGRYIRHRRAQTNSNNNGHCEQSPARRGKICKIEEAVYSQSISSVVLEVIVRTS